MYALPDLPTVPPRARLSTERERDEACKAMERLLDAGLTYAEARAAVSARAALPGSPPRRSQRG